jgi:hypothetical protein
MYHAYMFPLAIAVMTSVLAASSAPATAKVEFSAAYQVCTESLFKQPPNVDEALAKCQGPAAAGIPGAEYAMGELLMNRNKADDMEAGIQWLEKAVSSGSPQATYRLALILLGRPDAASVSRGRTLFLSAVCVGYPEALDAVKEQGLLLNSVSCEPAVETDFTGEWVLNMRWDKKSEAAPLVESYRITLTGNTPHVFIKSGTEWSEAKPGKFTVKQEGQSLNVSAMDSGWDFDGKWIESWTFQLLRTGVDESSVWYLRTVNNPYLPSRFAWKTFGGYAEGIAHRIHK